MPVKLSDIQLNPENPRVISDVKLRQLTNSLLSLPKMMKVRQIVCNSKKNPVSQGGNQRLKVLNHISDLTEEELNQMIEDLPIDETRKKYSRKVFMKILKDKEIPDGWVAYADDFGPDELDEFIIKDNIPYGAWDWEAIKDKWDKNTLEQWGMELPPWVSFEDYEDINFSYGSDNVTNENMIEVTLVFTSERYDEVQHEIEEFIQDIGCEKHKIKGKED